MAKEYPTFAAFIRLSYLVVSLVLNAFLLMATSFLTFTILVVITLSSAKGLFTAVLHGISPL